MEGPDAPSQLPRLPPGAGVFTRTSTLISLDSPAAESVTIPREGIR